MPTHRQLVDAAIADGRVSAQSRQTWINALAADPASTKRVLASLTPLPADLRPGKRAPAVSSTNLTAPRVVASDDRFEVVEYGRAPTVQEGLEDLEYRMTLGRDGQPAPTHGAYVRDKSGPQLIDHGDGTASWAPYTAGLGADL